MKKLLFLLCMLTILFACSQPEVESLTQEKVEEISSRAMGMEEQKPDVYVEAGCLVFKDFNVRDSIVNVLDQLNDEQRIAWEKNLGFVSAKTYYAPYFYEYDNVKSEEECLLFAEKYASILDITKDEDGCIDVEYPFATHGLEFIVNFEGKVFVGNALYLYKKDRRVVIHFADKERIQKFNNASMSSESNLIDVIYNHDATVLFRGNISRDVSLENSGGYVKSGKKQYKWDLIYSWERVMGPGKYDFRNHSYLRLHQRARKKYLGGWHDYSTNYSVRNVEVSIQGGGMNESFTGPEKSISRKNGANFTFFHVQSFQLGNPGLMPEGSAKLYISVKADHKSSFFNWPGKRLDYTKLSGEVSDAIVFSPSSPNKLYY